MGMIAAWYFHTIASAYCYKWDALLRKLAPKAWLVHYDRTGRVLPQSSDPGPLTPPSDIYLESRSNTTAMKKVFDSTTENNDSLL